MPSIYRSAAGRQAVREWCEARLAGWPVPHERRRLTAHGAATHAVVVPGPKADGPAGASIVFVPGTNFNASTSLPLLTALAGLAAGPVVALDVPGQPGLSDEDRSAGTGGAGWYGTWLADAVRQLADEELLDGPLVLAGHSFGGAIVLAAEVPSATRRVVVSSGGLCKLRLPPGLLLTSMFWLLRPTPARSARLLRWLHAPGHEPRPELVGWMTLVATHADSSGSPWVADPVQAMPTVVASGENDVFLPPGRLGPAVRQRLGVELQVIAGAGHLVVDEQPDLIARLITAP